MALTIPFMKTAIDEPVAPPTATVAKPQLTRRAQELRDQHYAEFGQALEERDRLAERVRLQDEICAKATQKINALIAENGDLKSRLDDSSSRVKIYQIERDEAVVKTAKLEAKLQSIIRIAETDEQPLAIDAEAPNFGEAIAPAPPSHKDIIARIK